MRAPARAASKTSILALGLLTACGEGGTGPRAVTRAELLGDYVATTFTTESAGVTVDRRGQGAVFSITLHADGSTTGRLFVPMGAGDGGFSADLAGTFSFDEASGRVSFEHAADTFVRDMSFTAHRTEHVYGPALEARQGFGGTVIHVVLSQYVMAVMRRSSVGGRR